MSSMNPLKTKNDLVIAAEKELKIASEELADVVSKVEKRKLDFKEIFFEKFELLFNECQKLKESEKKTVGDIVKGVATDAAKVAAAAAAGGGIGYLACCLAGEKKKAAGPALVSGICAALITSWGILKEEDARERAINNAKIVVSTINYFCEDDKKAIETKQIINDIAELLCRRFEYAIGCLASNAKENENELGIHGLATFFVSAIFTKMPMLTTGEIERAKLDKKIKKLIAGCAVPNEGDGSYKYEYGFLKWDKKLANESEREWTLAGLLLRSPIYNEFNKQYYVRDVLGKKIRKKTDNKSKKYPLQIINGSDNIKYYVRLGESDNDNKKIMKELFDSLPIFKALKKVKKAALKIKGLKPNVGINIEEEPEIYLKLSNFVNNDSLDAKCSNEGRTILMQYPQRSTSEREQKRAEKNKIVHTETERKIKRESIVGGIPCYSMNSSLSVPLDCL